MINAHQIRLKPKYNVLMDKSKWYLEQNSNWIKLTCTRTCIVHTHTKLDEYLFFFFFGKINTHTKERGKEVLTQIRQISKYFIPMEKPKWSLKQIANYIKLA